LYYEIKITYPLSYFRMFVW